MKTLLKNVKKYFFACVFCFLCIPAYAENLAKEYTIHVMDFYPSHYRDKDGVITGRMVDRIKSAYEAVGIKTKFVLVPINRCIYLLSAGQANICGTLAVSKNSRYENIEFHNFSIGQKKQKTLFVKNPHDKSQYDLNNLNKQIISVFDLPEYSEDLKRRGALVDLTTDDMAVIKKIKSKRVQLGIIHQATLDYLSKEDQKDLVVIGEFLEIEGFVGFSSKFEDRKIAMEQLDRGLKMIFKNGKIEQLEKFWSEKTKSQLNKK